MVAGIILHIAPGLPQDKVILRKLDDNPGLLPIKLGNAKFHDYSYTLIHFYDLNPIITEINKLYLKSENISKTLDNHTQYFEDSANYLKVLGLVQDRVENKIKEIIPHPRRYKRGLINMLGSVFKAISGNLDASDGEHYETLITELQSNQNNLKEHILHENSLLLNIITKFDDTIVQVGKHEKLLEARMNQISWIVQKTTYRENALYIKQTLNEIINIYTLIDSILQDIENSITFCKLKTMHPSIIKTEDLFKEIKILEKRLGEKQLPLKAEFENILLLEQLINIECFIVNNKVHYLLHIPITFKESFEIFQLYSAPIFDQSRFKVILPRSKFLIKNELQYAYQNQACQKIAQQLYLCEKKTLQEVHQNSPCAVRLLSSAKDTSTCHPVEAHLKHPVINQLSSSNKWLVIIPEEDVAKIKCFSQLEKLKLFGTYILEIPNNCEVSVNDLTIINDQKNVRGSIQPILFPDLGQVPSSLPLLDLREMQMDDLSLDDLQKLRSQIADNQPTLNFMEAAKFPSIWTMLVYVLLLASCAYLLYKKLCRNLGAPANREPAQLPQPIQLP